MLAVSAGVLAAGAAAGILSDSGGGDAPMIVISGNGDYSDLAEFHGVSSVGPQDVVITYGEKQSVRPEGSPEAIALLEVVVEEGQLIIRPRTNSWLWAWSRLNSTTYHVTLPRLESVSLEGSGNIRVDKVEGDTFSATIERSGDLSIDSLKVDSANFIINGPGDISASGTARDTRVMIEGPGDFRANALRSQTASVTVNGPGDAKLTVDTLANISVSGPGDVDIAGSARCTISKSGPGDVDCESGSNDD